MKLFPKAKDERVVAEINHIYKIGFHVLSFGILVDIILQAVGIRFEGTTMGDSSINLLEFAVVMLSWILCTVLMGRKGMMDDNAYAEADRSVVNSVFQWCGLGVHERAVYPAGSCQPNGFHGACGDGPGAADYLRFVPLRPPPPPEIGAIHGGGRIKLHDTAV